MTISAAAVRIAQRHLQAAGFEPGPVDGRLGPRTEEALDGALVARRDELSPRRADGILYGGSRPRKVTAFLQLLAHDAGIDAGPVDGWWGPRTDYAVMELSYFEEHGVLPHRWRDASSTLPNPHGWPLAREAELRAFYGDPAEPPLVAIEPPYPLRLNWDLRRTVSTVRCHEKVAASLLRILTRVGEHYGADGVRDLHLDRFGGCFAPRRVRGGSAWSTHAWGVALDFDTERNRLTWGFDRAAFARSEYEAWWGFWEQEGWVGLGRVANFDWMHVQAARWR